MTRPLLGLLVLWTTTACPPAVDVDQGPIVVGPEGGLFVRPARGYALDVPRGALAETVTIDGVMRSDGIPEVPGRVRVSLGLELSPSTLTFSSPARLYLPWLAERLPAGVEAGALDMRRGARDEAPVKLPGVRTNTTPFEAVEALTDRLGLFWLTSPTEPEGLTIELEPREAELRPGDTQHFTTRLVSPSGATVEAPVRWSSLPARVGSVDEAGTFAAAAPGIATITAQVGDRTSTATVAVRGGTDGPLSWAHVNPSPTGNDLFGGAAVPGGLGVVFAGANGTVLLRTPDGAFTRLGSARGLVLRQVAGTSPDDAVAVGRAGSSGVLVEFQGTRAPKVSVWPSRKVGELGALWFDGTHGMAGGTGNEVLIRRDGGWTTEYHPSFETLLSVLGDGAGGFVVVGELGSIYRWDPTREVWDAVYEHQLSVKLESAQLVDARSAEAWATGDAQLWHFLDGGWDAEPLPSATALASTTCVGALAGRLVVGAELRLDAEPEPPARGAVLVRTAHGAPDGGPRWAALPLRSQQVPRGVVVAGETAWVVGDLGAVWAFDGPSGVFREESHGFYGDVAGVAVAPERVYAAVNECTSVRCTARAGSVLASTADGGWEALGALPLSQPLLALTAGPGGQLLASASDGVASWRGDRWTPTVVGDAAGALLAFAWCGPRLWAAGQTGAVYVGTAERLDRATGGPVAPFGDATAIHCPSEAEVWVAGDGFLASREGDHWRSVVDAHVVQRGWRAVWSPGPSEAYAFGDATYGVRFDGQTLRAVENPGGVVPDVVSGMWGASIDTLTMVGLSTLPEPLGFALRFDGVAFHPIDLGAHRAATAIDGRASSEVWIGTRGGGLLRSVAR